MNRTIEATPDLSERAPRSAASFPVNLAGLGLGLFVIWLLRDDPTLSNTFKAGLASLAIFLTIGSYELFVVHANRRPSAALSGTTVRTRSLRRVALRLLAIGAIYAVLGCAYFVFPEYHGTFYQPFWEGLQAAAPWLIIATPVYFFWIDAHQRETDDAYLQLGTLLLTQRGPENWKPMRELIASWVVKAFFLPLMVVLLVGQVDASTRLYQGALDTPIMLFSFVYNIGYLIDLLFAVVGYTCMLRIFDSHNRSVEPTALGWIVALICYQPFFSPIYAGYVRYEGGIYWDSWLAGWPIVKAIWGVVIIAVGLTYALSTAAFGLRFSNLTNRGIITGGPYRWTKHPAYITKLISFWMISLPFVSPLGSLGALRTTAGFALLCVIYWLRARTEERHLMSDPDYRAYAAWIGEHGVFAKLARLCGLQSS